MSGITALSWLKLKSLCGRWGAMLLFLLLPFLLILPAGLAEEANDASSLRAIVVDLADTEESHFLVQSLRKSEVRWEEMSEGEAEREVKAKRAMAMVLIPEDFSIPDKPLLVLESVERPDGFTVIIEDLSTALLPMLPMDEMEQNLLASADGIDEETLHQQFLEKIEANLEEGYGIQFRIVGRENMRRSIVLSPGWSPEILILSLYSVFSCSSFFGRAGKRRLLSIPGAYCRDYLASLFALLILGAFQILLLLLGLKACFPEMSLRASSFVILFSFLLSQIIFAQFTMLLPGKLQLSAALFLSFFSALAGGAFFPLPSSVMNASAIYFPHGRALGLLDGMDISNPILYLLPLLALSACLQKKKLLRGSSFHKILKD